MYIESNCRSKIQFSSKKMKRLVEFDGQSALMAGRLFFYNYSRGLFKNLWMTKEGLD